jgi:hypothetical protein
MEYREAGREDVNWIHMVHGKDCERISCPGEEIRRPLLLRSCYCRKR